MISNFLREKLKFFLGQLIAWINETFKRNQFSNSLKIFAVHCVKSVCIRSFSGPYFPTFGLNTERYRIFPIQSEREKILTGEAPDTNTFHAFVVLVFEKIGPTDKANYRLISILPWKCFSTFLGGIKMWNWTKMRWYSKFLKR